MDILIYGTLLTIGAILLVPFLIGRWRRLEKYTVNYIEDIPRQPGLYTVKGIGKYYLVYVGKDSELWIARCDMRGRSLISTARPLK